MKLWQLNQGISTGADNTVKLWDVKARDCIHSITCGDAITSVRFTPDGKWVAGSAKDGTVVIWDLVAGKPLVLAGTSCIFFF